MSTPHPTRRRFLAIAAAASAGAALALRGNDADAASTEWRGIALGADARLLLLGGDETAARAAIGECLAEIDRLEDIFSLHRPDSEICRLNRQGMLAAPSLDLRHVLDVARWVHAHTRGLFDPTIQPVWELFAASYGRGSGAPPPLRLLAAMAGVGLERVRASQGGIELPPGGAITLNGIAQGYITDRVCAILRERGWRHVLADVGEVGTTGARPDGMPFHVAIRDAGLDVALGSGALATSAPGALRFTPDGRIAHILDPRVPERASAWRSVTVAHASATVADGLSTALALADEPAIRSLVAATDGLKVWAVPADRAAAPLVLG